jgi:hypothetical protein
MKTLIILFLIVNIINVKGHSAVSCTDKRTKEVCMGFSRYYHFNHINTILPSSDKNDTFYASRDRETLIQAGIEKICPEMNIQEYTKEYPMGQVKRGQKITLQHPPRGHSEQPSSNVWIYMNKNVNEYPMNKQPKNTSLELIGEYKFDNCYGIEKEISWANCTGSITIPNNIQSGIYTFVWRWDLNNIPYSDCFELDTK